MTLASVLLLLSVLSCVASASEEADVNFPLFKWAQDRGRIWITVHVAEVEEGYTVDFRESGVLFQGVGGKDGKAYRLDLDFLRPIDTEQSTWQRFDNNFKLTIFKKEEARHWPHLLSTTQKLEEGNMRIDWTRWTVEDATEEAEGAHTDEAELDVVADNDENKDDDDDDDDGEKPKEGKKKRRRRRKGKARAQV